MIAAQGVHWHGSHEVIHSIYYWAQQAYLLGLWMDTGLSLTTSITEGGGGITGEFLG